MDSDMQTKHSDYGYRVLIGFLLAGVILAGGLIVLYAVIVNSIKLDVSRQPAAPEPVKTQCTMPVSFDSVFAADTGQSG